MSEAQIPASEATEQMIPASLVAELLADAAQRYCPELERVEAEAYANSRWTHDARLRLLHAPAPSPEIRERAIELSRTLRLIKRLAIEHDTEIVLGHEYVDDLLVILDALKGAPELRERILAALYVADYGELLNWTTDSVAGRKNMVRRLDAVLSALGEPK